MFLINHLGAGGAERSLAEMLPGFVEAGIQPLIVCFFRRPTGVEESVLAQGYDVRFVSDRTLPSRIRATRRILRAERPDLVHTSIFDADVIGRLAAAGTGIPVLSSLINTSYSKARLGDDRIRAWKLWLARQVDAWTARHLTAHFHAITRTVKQAAMEDLGIRADRITVVERGRDPRRLGFPGRDRRYHARRALGLDEGHYVIVNVGRQEYQKGQVDLVEAMAELRKIHSRAVLLIAGRQGNATPDLTDLHRSLELEEEIRFLGHREDLPEILAAADLFAFPSLYEGLGGALIEAMALGLPIVASNLPVLHEVVEEDRNCVFVEPGSARDLALGIRSLIEDPKRARSYGRRSREIFEDRFTLDKSLERMIDLYRKVVGQGLQGGDPPGLSSCCASPTAKAKE